MVILGVSLHLLSFMSMVCLLLTTSYARIAPCERLDILLLCFPFWHEIPHRIDLQQSLVLKITGKALYPLSIILVPFIL